MAELSIAELGELLVTTAFSSEAFTVSKGEKTLEMIEIETAKANVAAESRKAQGLPPTNKAPPAPPDPATIPVLERLASVLKYFIKGDQVLEAETKIKFKAHFAGVLSAGVLVLELACDSVFDAALPSDVSYKMLVQLGMHRGGIARGVETLGNCIKSRSYGACMPTGEIADNFLVLKKLLVLDPDLAGGKLEFNEMDCAITVNRQRVEDNVTTGDIRIAIGETYFVPNHGKKGMRSFVPSEAFVQQAMENIARKNKYHPAREFMQGLRGTWNGTSEFMTLLKETGGFQPEVGTPEQIAWIKSTNELALSQWRKTFIGSVARTMDPGCQMDTMLVLKSGQGTKKSSLFRALAPANRFSDAHLDFGNKDALMAMQQNSWYECSELSGMVKSIIQVVKGFITSRSDDFRLPYGRSMTKNPRHCILVGTTNDDTPLRDNTGSRRFWIIVVDDTTKTNMIVIERIVPTLWAEAIEIYYANTTCADCIAAVDGERRCPNHRWWLTKAEDDLREKFNEQFTEKEPYVEWLGDFISNAIADKNMMKQGLHVKHQNTDALKVHELLEAAGQTPKDCHDPAQQRRMVYALKKHKYLKKHTENGNVWISPGMQNRPLKIVPKPQITMPDKPESEAEEILTPVADSTK